MCSHHFSPKVIPSWLYTGFKSLSVCTGWKQKQEKKINITSIRVTKKVQHKKPHNKVSYMLPPDIFLYSISPPSMQMFPLRVTIKLSIKSHRWIYFPLVLSGMKADI